MTYANLKNSLVTLSLFGLVIYCSEDPELGDENLLGKWQLTEKNYSGEGSGEFQPVDSEKYIEFMSNGQVRSNGNLCEASSDSDMETRGNFYFTETDSIIEAENCNKPFPFPKFSISENEMTLTYFRFDKSYEKYVKIP